MSSRKETSALSGSARGTQWSAPSNAPANSREARRDPLGSENIDAQIRWFFENAPERDPLRP